MELTRPARRAFLHPRRQPRFHARRLRRGRRLPQPRRRGGRRPCHPAQGELGLVARDLADPGPHLGSPDRPRPAGFAAYLLSLAP